MTRSKGSSRPRGGRRPRTTSRPGTSSSSRTGGGSASSRRYGRYASHVAGSAATIALVAPESDGPSARETFQYDLGQATISIMLAAADQGIGSCHSAVIDQELAREILGLSTDRRCEWLISLGYPADRPLTPIVRPNRRPFDEVVHRDRW